jgi:hypothetical protein
MNLNFVVGKADTAKSYLAVHSKKIITFALIAFIVFVVYFAPFTNAAGTKTTNGFLEINKDSKFVDNISFALSENKAVDVTFAGEKNTIAPLFDSKEIDLNSVAFKLIFHQVSNNSYKYDFAFNSGAYSEFSLSFSTIENCNIISASVYCGKQYYNFIDLNGTEYKLENQSGGFKLTLLNLEPNKDYFFDP